MYSRIYCEKAFVRLFSGMALLVSALVSVGCGAPFISTISVTPGSSTIALGETSQFKVVAHYSDGSTEDVTHLARWMTLNTRVATVSATGLVTTVQSGTATITADALGMTGNATLTVSNAALTGVSITVPSAPLAVGLSAQLKATGTYTDQSAADVTNQVQWTVAQPAVLSINTAGLAVATAAGATQVTASLKNFSANAQLTVAPAALASIGIQSKSASLPLGTEEQLSAIGTYTDGSTVDLTSKAIWASTAPDVLSVTSTGTASTKSVGAASVSATLGSTVGTSAMTVSPAALVSLAVSAVHPSLPLGSSEQLSATGTFTDKTTKDVTASAAWTSAAPGVAIVNSGGLIQTKGMGSALLSATVSGVTASTTLNVSSAALVSIAISAGTANLPIGETLQLAAVGTFTDGSNQDLTGSAAWTSSAPDVLTFRSQGLVAGLTIGAADVTATSGDIRGVQSLTVSAAALSSISLTPVAPTVLLGSSLQLSVTGTFSDGSTQDVTSQASWNLDSAVIASISPTGVVTGLQAGSTGIEVSVSGQQTSDTLTVQPLVAVSYFDNTSSADSTIRVTNPGATGQDICAMIYVFDQDQQMSECCGCLASQDGLLTLSLKTNLLSNPLTGVTSKTGTVMLVPGVQATSGGCNASSVTPAGIVVAWSTHLPAPKSGQSSTAEDPFSSSALSATSSAALQAQCAFIQQLGSGQGICGCGGSE